MLASALPYIHTFRLLFFLANAAFHTISWEIALHLQRQYFGFAEGFVQWESSRVFYSLVIKPATNQTILLWFSVASSAVHRISREMEVLF